MSDGEVKRHHLLSRVLLKQWLGPHPGFTELSCYNISRDKIEQVGPRGISWRHERLHPTDPRGFEDFWRDTEHKVEPILSCINNGTIPVKDSWEDTLKDLLAIHLVRSITYVENHQMRFQAAIDNLDLSEEPDDLLATAFMTNQDGVISSTSLQGELAHQNYRDYLKRKVGTGPYHSDAMKAIFPFFRTSISKRKCALRRIPEASKDSTFLISDCPVLPLTISNGKPAVADQMFGPEVGTYVFPIGPKVSIQLSNVNSEQEASLREIDLLNELQIRNAQYEIVWDVKSDNHLETVRRVRAH